MDIETKIENAKWNLNYHNKSIKEERATLICLKRLYEEHPEVKQLENIISFFEKRVQHDNDKVNEYTTNLRMFEHIKKTFKE